MYMYNDGVQIFWRIDSSFFKEPPTHTRLTYIDENRIKFYLYVFRSPILKDKFKFFKRRK